MEFCFPVTIPEKSAVRNTIYMDSKEKGRAWCFTLNNYMESEIKNLQTDKYQYLFQKEIGENKTPHLQGVIRFKEPVRFSAVKKLNSRAHWEKCKNWNASLNYCSKKDTSEGDLYTNIPKFMNMSRSPRRNPEEILLYELYLEYINQSNFHLALNGRDPVTPWSFEEWKEKKDNIQHNI